MRIAVFAILSLFVGAVGSYIIFKKSPKPLVEENTASYHDAQRNQARFPDFFDYPLRFTEKTLDRYQEKNISKDEEIWNQKNGYLHKIQNQAASPIEKTEPQYYRHGRSHAVWSESTDFE